MQLLTADWHLTDDQESEYRWLAFDRLYDIAQKYQVTKINHLGDLVDTSDRHSATFVNRLISKLLESPVPIDIIKGNHDTPLRGPAFWEFLSQTTKQIRYLTKPTMTGTDELYLPFTANPKDDWIGLSLSQFKVLYMHVTYPGALSENGTSLPGSKLPILPRGVKIYSGDVHTPQTIRNFVHVGAPHPIHYGDNYPCRMLLLNDDYEIVKEITLDTVKKHMIDITSVEDLECIQVNKGDFAKIRYNLPGSDISKWAELSSKISSWANDRGVKISQPEITVNTLIPKESITAINPEEIMQEFLKVEKIEDESLIQVGLQLLTELRQ